MTAVAERVDCPMCPSRGVDEAHIQACADRVVVVSDLLAYAAKRDRPPSPLHVTDLFAHLSSNRELIEAFLIARVVIDLGWRPAFGAPGP